MSKRIEVAENKNRSVINKIVFCRCGNPLYIEKLVSKCSYVDGVVKCVNNRKNNEK